ncbi:MAG: peptidylprolyl isomerase [Armatimonadetes bacterium]|nr:peptidylprolyl isomerase [Armatimonadota bacterium]
MLTPFALSLAAMLVPERDTVTFSVYQRGTFVVTLDYKSAPKTCAHFAKNVEAGMYDGMLWHRKVNGFVLQTGDPESKTMLPEEARAKPGENGGTQGLGEKTEGPTIEFEKSPLPHLKGTLGIALESPGDNSGSSHFFINLVDNKRLNGKYVCFAKVTSGWDVVEKCERGDLILSAKIN